MAVSVQNLITDITKDIALEDSSLKLQYISKDPSNTASFSNLVGNINAKSEQTKTKFVDKAVKSNTSSINKLALNSDNSKKNSSKTKIQ